MKWTNKEEDYLAEKYIEYSKQGRVLYRMVEEWENHPDFPSRSWDSLEYKIKKLKNEGRVRSYEYYAPDQEPDSSPEPSNQIKVEQKRGKVVLESPRSNRITTLDDLIRECDVDVKDWNVERHIINKWEVGSSDPDGGVVVEPLFQVKAWLQPRPDMEAVEAVKEEALQAIRNYNPGYEDYEYQEGDCLLEIGIYDLHLGMLNWGKETNENYDLDIAEAVFKEAVMELLEKAKRHSVEKIIFPFGNDFFHYDGEGARTSAGTEMADADKRSKKVYMMGYDLLRWAIDEMRKTAPVYAFRVEGNHDREVGFYLGHALEAWYNGVSGVEIKNHLRPRSYYSYGVNLLGFCHGDQKLDRLRMIMPVEASDVWDGTVYREWHIGHFHHRSKKVYQTIEDDDGIVIRILPSLAATDSWHFQRGMVGPTKSAEAYVWNKETGLEAVLVANRPVNRSI